MSDMPEVLIVTVEDETVIVYEPEAESAYRSYEGGEARYILDKSPWVDVNDGLPKPLTEVLVKYAEHEG